MKKILFFSLIFLVVYINYSYAATSTATPDEYIVTINKVELFNSSTGSWEIVGEGDLTFDIASINAGQIAGGYASNASIPAGVYTQERTTVSRTFYLTASGSIGGTTYYTSTGSTSLDGIEPGVTDGSAANIKTTASAVRGTTVLPTKWLTDNGFTVQGDYFYHEGNLPSPITIIKGITKRMRVKFDVTDKVQFDNSIGGGATTGCYPLSPDITFEVAN